ncbi:Outer membrane receptor for ferrienterochelin and colicins [Catalinimonas alkaloidigena]|uniref:Outer membrane receptor for ferrienterochelin and colicins n=1 Tax=Catalinimonas alkaloidigena TaxID=1075417 RepID=A0A1G8WDU8_9BACT|nr:TonB-dependent receptor [Catalinimonas alkaloidigena]SDJ76509.1 Outer membrane receptor for ferrienterochelin and colicins [Catalinimonas alkaloidigena]
MRHTISGYVREAGSAELLIGVNVYLPALQRGTTTNSYGFYSLTLPEADTVELVFSYVGYQPKSFRVPLRAAQQLDVALRGSMTLQEVVVEAPPSPPVSSTVQMSAVEVPIAQVKAIPALLGEKDVLKVLQLMPGVQSGSEGNSGLYVRGGGPDQNLIILDDAVVYNAYHLFGFFSLFNGDALKSVELTKGGFPARYGGRLSSVLEMNMKDGNKETLQGEAGLGLISSRLTLEGPLVKNKASFLISGRRTYADLLIRPFLPEGDGGYYFWDLNGKLNYDFGRNDKVYLSGYFGRDRFFFSEKEDDYQTKAGINWGNATGTVRWNHLYSERLFANTSLIFSNYRFNIFVDETQTDAEGQEEEFNLRYYSGVRDWSLKHDLFYVPNPRHTLRLGLHTTLHRFTPSAFVANDPDVGENRREVTPIDGVESGVYLEDTYQPTPLWLLNGGIRLSHFYTNGRHYINPEPRLALAYKFRDDWSVKASYATMNQYIHLLSNTGVGLPTDLWVPSTARIRPQRSQQVALGLAKDFMQRDLALTIEGYYKKMDHIINYKEGASFFLIEDGPEGAAPVSWEENVTTGQGWSYGAEVLLQRKVGKFSGWIGYTLSWTQLQFEELNQGKPFWARYDRRHDVSVVGIYRPSDRITLSGTWVYGTGNAITLPLADYRAPYHIPGQSAGRYSGNYWVGGYNVEDYGERNAYRMAPYHRLDVGIQFHKQTGWGERTWELSFYNTYARQNPFFYFIEDDQTYDEQTQQTTYRTLLKQVSLFPIVPSISYSLKF